MSHPLPQSQETGMLKYLLAVRWVALSGKIISCASMSREVLTEPLKGILFLGLVMTLTSSGCNFSLPNVVILITELWFG